jgi:hypothetical protein
MRFNGYLAPVYGFRDPELDRRFNVIGDTGRIQGAKLRRIRIHGQTFPLEKNILKHFLISSH